MRWSGGIVRRNDAAPGELFAGGIRRQEEADAARQIFGGDGAGGAVGPSGGASATALPDWQARSAADRPGADAAALLRAAMVRAGRRGGGGCAVRQPGIARFCRHRSSGGVGAGRDDPAALPPLAGAARPDQSVVRRDRGDAGGARPVDASGHDRRCDHHRCAVLDQEQGEESRPGDAPRPGRAISGTSG